MLWGDALPDDSHITGEPGIMAGGTDPPVHQDAAGGHPLIR
jgi:hypothetical protein